VRVVEREAHHPGRDALLMAVELADLDLRAEGGAAHVHPAERDVRLQDRRAGAAGHHAHLATAAGRMDAIPVAGRLVPLELEPDQDPLRRSLAAKHGLPADELLVAL